MENRIVGRGLVYVILAAAFLAAFMPAPKVEAYTTSTRAFNVLPYEHTLYRESTSYESARESLTGTLYGVPEIDVGGQTFLGGWYAVYRSILFFDTSFLPDEATLTSAKNFAPSFLIR